MCGGRRDDQRVAPRGDRLPAFSLRACRLAEGLGEPPADEREKLGHARIVPVPILEWSPCRRPWAHDAARGDDLRLPGRSAVHRAPRRRGLRRGYRGARRARDRRRRIPARRLPRAPGVGDRGRRPGPTSGVGHHVLGERGLDCRGGRGPRARGSRRGLPERRALRGVGARARPLAGDGGRAGLARGAPGAPVVRPRAHVVVVGGGPPGALAAVTLAAPGVAPLLLDKKRFPRDKPCGGGIRYGVLRRFPAPAGYLPTTVEVHEIRKVRMEGPSGASLLAESDEPFYLTLRRPGVDGALLAPAPALGAPVLQAALVTDLLFSADGVAARAVDGRVFTARLVIGADGVNGVVAR